MEYTLEIKAGEGGGDAKQFVNELMDAYIKWFDREN